MSAPRQQKSSYHQKALQQIRNSLQPFATSESGSTSSGISSLSSSNNDYGKEYSRPPQSSSPSRHSPRGIEYRAQQYPFVPSQVPPSVQQLLRRIDSPSSPSSSSSNSPTSQLAPIVKKPTLIIKSTVVPKPVLQTAVPYSLPPPLPPKPKPKLHPPEESPPSLSAYSQQVQVQPSSQGHGRVEITSYSNSAPTGSASSAVNLPPPPLPLHQQHHNHTPNPNSNHHHHHQNINVNTKNILNNNNNNHYYYNNNNNDIISSLTSSQQPQPQIAQPQIPRARTPPSPRTYAFDYAQLPHHQYHQFKNPSPPLQQSHHQQILPHLLQQQQQQQQQLQYPHQILQNPSMGTNQPTTGSTHNNNNSNNAHQPQHHQQPQHQQSSHYNYHHSQQQPLPPSQPILQTKAFLDSETSVNVNSNSVNNGNGSTTNGSHTSTTTVDRKSPPEVTTHESPIPERKKLSREKEEERFESKVRVYSPQAFKFFMEQHVENVIKSHKERVNRRLQLEAEMAKIGLSEEAQTQMRRMLSQKESNYIRLKRAKMDKSMFKCIRTIGVGAFGEVTLVRKLDTQHLYAMKTLRKSDVLRRNQVAHVKAERDILAEADNEWVVKLYYSFQDMDHLYFVMDYIPGGDLMSLLIKKGIFEESLAQFYIAELTCAVESVHKMGFIHRDIKPDNILIDRDGHIKLTDFGLCTGFRWTHNSKYYQDSNSCHCEQNCQWQTCPGDSKPLEIRRKKEHIRCLAHSLVGTPNYIAPEVLMRTGYTQLCDWWSVGVILYEMLVGQPPFLAPTPAETQYKVINWATSLRIPSQAHLSSQAKDLILKLCTDHTRRLGKNGPQQVKSHSFFIPIDFQSGLRRTVAPFIPKIRHPTDTSNFDPCDGDKPEDADPSNLDSNQFHGFFEFTFRRFFDDAYNNEEGGPVYV